VLSYHQGRAQPHRAGRYLPRHASTPPCTAAA